MAFDFQTFWIALVFGTVFSAAVSLAFQVISRDMKIENDLAKVVLISMLMLAGPHLLLQAAHRSLREGIWPTEYVVGCYLLSGAWAVALGFGVLILLTAQ